MTLLAGLLACAFALWPDDKDTKTADPLEGVWILLSVQVEGKEDPGVKVETVVYEFKRGRVLIRTRDNEQKGAYELVSGQRPAAFDLLPQSGREKGKRLRGIYELKGDVLRICLPQVAAQSRPKEFGSKPGSESVLMILQRDKP